MEEDERRRGREERDDRGAGVDAREGEQTDASGTEEGKSESPEVAESFDRGEERESQDAKDESMSVK